MMTNGRIRCAEVCRTTARGAGQAAASAFRKSDRHWFDLNGGDGMYAIPAVDNPNLIYNNTEDGVFMIFDRASEHVHDIEPYPRDASGGGVADLPYRFAWNAGFAVSPQNPAVLYAGGNVVFESEDRGRTWKPISPDLTLNDKSKQQSSGGPVVKDNSGAEVYDAIIRIAPSPKDSNTIWVGTDDGQVQLTRDGGTNPNRVGIFRRRHDADDFVIDLGAGVVLHHRAAGGLLVASCRSV